MSHVWTQEFVTVGARSFEGLVDKLSGGPLQAPDWRLPVYPEDDHAFVQFIGALNAVNFCFTDPVTGQKYAADYDGVAWSGAMGMAAALRKVGGGPENPLWYEDLARLSLAEAEHAFLSSGAPLPLLAERVAALNSVGVTLAKEWGPSFMDLVEACDFDALQIEEALVRNFPAYSTDAWLHPVTKDLYVFNKRARLFVLMYEGRARSSNGNLPMLERIDAIGPVVDYQLPRMLRACGVLTYSPALAEAVDKGHLLGPGSLEELAIRSVTDQVVRELLAEVRARVGDHVTMCEIDYALWAGGRNAQGAHHLTLTRAY